jgi:hypothetical protein
LRTFTVKIPECFHRSTISGRRRINSIQIRVPTTTIHRKSEPPIAKMSKATVSCFERFEPSVQQSCSILAASAGDITAGGEPDFETPI